MLVFVISSAIALLIATFVFNFGDYILWFFKSLKYIKQGIKVRYTPIVGYMKHSCSPGSEDGLEKWHRLFRKDEDPTKSEPLILANGAGSIPILFINDMELAKDYFKRDSEITCPTNLEGMPFNHSFIFQYGKKAMADRAIFAEIFYPTYMRKLTPPIHAIIKRHIAVIKKRLREAKSEEEQVFDLKYYIQNIFRDIVSFVLFGDNVPKVDGLSIIDQIENIVVGYFMYNSTSLAHKLTGGLYTKLGLSAEHNRLEALDKKICSLIKDIINSRKNSKEYKRSINVIDLLLAHNEKVEAQGQPQKSLTIDQIVSYIKVMIFAGFDTSKNITLNSTDVLANNPDIQSALRSCVRENIFDKEGGEESYDAYVELQLLDNFVTEALRLYTPAWVNLLHMVYKDFKMGKYKVSKGTAVRITVITLQSKPEYFKNPRKFDLKKYDENKNMKELKRYAIIPFLTGKRPCPGKNLAEVAIKMILSNLVNELELVPSGEPNRRMVEMNYTIQHCKFRLKAL